MDKDIIKASIESVSPQLNAGQRTTLEKLMRDPKPANLNFEKLVSLLQGLGAYTSECGKTSGSRVCVLLNGVRMVLHRPHPGKDADKGAIGSVRQFLINAGVLKDE